MVNRFLGGYRADKSPWFWRLSPLNSLSEVSPSLRITATCALVSPIVDDKRFLMVKNVRGYDLPGGHIEPGETYMDALIREVKEEARINIHNISLLGLLESDCYEKPTGLLLYRAFYQNASPFQATAEITERLLVTYEDLFHKYCGNEQLMRLLLDMVGKNLASQLKTQPVSPSVRP